MVERRDEQRQKSLLGGKVVFGRRQSVMDCLVRNVSPHGALLVFSHTSITPSEFMLDIPSRETTYSAKLMWRTHDRAGVRLSETEMFPVAIETAKRTRALEAETRRLKKQVDPGAW